MRLRRRRPCEARRARRGGAVETRGNGPGLDEPVGFGPVASRGLFSDGLMEKLHFFLEKVLFTPLNLWPSLSFLSGLENRPNWVLRVLILGNLPLWPGLKAVSSHLAPRRRHAAFMTWHGPTCQVPPHQHPRRHPLPIRFPIPLSFPNPRNPRNPILLDVERFPYASSSSLGHRKVVK